MEDVASATVSEKRELQVKLTRGRYGSFYGHALIAEPEPGIEVLESFGRPTAVWIEASGRLYLLHGWHAVPSNTIQVREFASQKIGAEIPNATALRELLAEEDSVTEYPSDDSAMPPEDCELLNRLLARYRDAARARMPPENATDPKGQRDKESITRLLEEWLNDISDQRVDELIDARFSISRAISLLQQAGFLDEGSEPTEQAEQIGIVRAAWRNRWYALYPRERFGEYRDLIYGLYKAAESGAA